MKKILLLLPLFGGCTILTGSFAVRCGDGFLQGSEECDDGNTVSGDDCDENCTFTACGNEIVTPGEVCDDGNTTSGDGCDSFCLEEACGNGVVQSGELCDDGNNVDDDVCTNECTLQTCGDNVVDSGEDCDGTDLNNNTCVLEGFAGGELSCSANCAGFDTTDCNACGDGSIDVGEECDNGANNSDIAADACRTNCQAPDCGDNVIDTGEGCDDGAQCNNGAPCVSSADCPGQGECHPRAGDGCSEGCLLESFCGDGLAGGSEECDDGNTTTNDGCDSDCTRTELKVVAGGAHTCIQTDEGAVKCWGKNDKGQLGYGNTNSIGDNESPFAVGFASLGQSTAELSLGGKHSCALLVGGAGSLLCWGEGSTGQLGYGNTTDVGDNEFPAGAGVINVGGVARRVAAGDSHSCALMDGGGVRCWGDNAFGQLGYGNINDIGNNEAPSTAGDVSLGGSAAQIAAGRSHTCALLTTGAVRCWGDATGGRLGYGDANNIGDNEAPSSVGPVDVGGVVVQIVAGGAHTCALLNNGGVRCWGVGSSGSLGYGNPNNIGDNEAPSIAGNVPVGGTATQIGVGILFSCALFDDGDVNCWGANNLGQLGRANNFVIGDTETPASVGNINLGGAAAQLSVGSDHACVVLTTGQIKCWGFGADGRLGYGNTSNIGDNETPDAVGTIAIFPP